MSVVLREITRDNWHQAIRLKVAEGQEHFVASNLYSIAESKFEPTFVPLAIYHGDTMVGFLMHGRDEHGHDWIIRLMIDRDHQGKGYGRAAMEQAIAKLTARPDCTTIKISYEPDNHQAERLYHSLGFAPTGEIEEGEIVARLDVKMC
ncbi:MAG TPA: GNAT family N-acetyltransferase [Herpetosiphonaceae bacterium]